MNKLSIFLAVVLCLTAALFIVLRAGSSGADGAATMRAVPAAPRPDADSPADTVRTLTAQLQNAGARDREQAQELERLRQEMTALKSQAGRPPPPAAPQVPEEVRQRLDTLNERVELLARRPQGAPLPEVNPALPIGRGSPPDGAPVAGPTPAAAPPARVIWILPAGVENRPIDGRDQTSPPNPSRLLQDSRGLFGGAAGGRSGG